MYANIHPDWSYRAQPPWAERYDHEHFITSLAVLMISVDTVIWLPRARINAPGQYQYRVWCSFEAAVVHLRDLPVIVAGHGMSGMQWAVAAWGSYLVLPWWWRSDGLTEIHELAACNLAFYVMSSIYIAVVVAYSSRALEPSDALVLLAVWLGFVALWMWRRGQGTAAALARNGRTILRVMLAGATPARAASCPLDVEHLVRQLAWLPAFDRRTLHPTSNSGLL